MVREIGSVVTWGGGRRKLSGVLAVFFFYFDEGGSCPETYVCRSTSNSPLKMVAFYFKASLSHFTERELTQKNMVTH